MITGTELGLGGLIVGCAGVVLSPFTAWLGNSWLANREHEQWLRDRRADVYRQLVSSISAENLEDSLSDEVAIDAMMFVSKEIQTCMRQLRNAGMDRINAGANPESTEIALKAAADALIAQVRHDLHVK